MSPSGKELIRTLHEQHAWSVEKLASAYEVSESTVQQWIESARDANTSAMTNEEYFGYGKFRAAVEQTP